MISFQTIVERIQNPPPDAVTLYWSTPWFPRDRVWQSAARSAPPSSGRTWAEQSGVTIREQETAFTSLPHTHTHTHSSAHIQHIVPAERAGWRLLWSNMSTSSAPPTERSAVLALLARVWLHLMFKARHCEFQSSLKLLTLLIVPGVHCSVMSQSICVET